MRNEKKKEREEREERKKGEKGVEITQKQIQIRKQKEQKIINFFLNEIEKNKTNKTKQTKAKQHLANINLILSHNYLHPNLYHYTGKSFLYACKNVQNAKFLHYFIDLGIDIHFKSKTKRRNGILSAISTNQSLRIILHLFLLQLDVHSFDCDQKNAILLLTSFNQNSFSHSPYKSSNNNFNNNNNYSIENNNNNNNNNNTNNNNYSIENNNNKKNNNKFDDKDEEGEIEFKFERCEKSFVQSLFSLLSSSDLNFDDYFIILNNNKNNLNINNNNNNNNLNNKLYKKIDEKEGEKITLKIKGSSKDIEKMIEKIIQSIKRSTKRYRSSIVNKIEFLRRINVDFTKRDKNGNNHFLSCSLSRQFPSLKYLKEKGEEIESVDKGGSNGFWIASSINIPNREHDLKLMHFIYKLGVNIYTKDLYQKNIFSRAIGPFQLDSAVHLVKYLSLLSLDLSFHPSHYNLNNYKNNNNKNNNFNNNNDYDNNFNIKNDNKINNKNIINNNINKINLNNNKNDENKEEKKEGEEEGEKREEKEEERGKEGKEEGEEGREERREEGEESDFDEEIFSYSAEQWKKRFVKNIILHRGKFISDQFIERVVNNEIYFQNDAVLLFFLHSFSL